MMKDLISSEDLRPVKEATKDILRIFVLAGASAVVAYLLSLLVTLPQTPVIAGLSTLLIWLDNYLREKAKEKPEAKVRGLVPF